jgi:RNA polymerase sigma factor (sigma-70 family)
MNLSGEHKLLWGEIRLGNKQALFDLYNDLYFHLVRYGISVHCDADLVKDCIGQLFLKLWDRHDVLGDVENVKSYLFTSLRRAIIDYLKTEDQVNTSIKEMYVDDAEEEELSYEEMIITSEKDNENRMRLREALKELSPKQIELIRMKFFDNLSYKEIATLNYQSVKTSYNTIHNAIKVLRLKLKP